MPDDQTDEEKEQAALMERVGKTLFPEAHLAPWASILKKRESALNIGLLTLADIGQELDRRVWLDQHPGEPLPESLKNKPIEEDSTPPGTEKPEPQKNPFSVEFDPQTVRGAAGMFAFCARQLAIHSHDIAPSVDGVGRKQGNAILMAQKTGVMAEPPKRSLWEKVTFRGKDKEKLA